MRNYASSSGWSFIPQDEKALKPPSPRARRHSWKEEVALRSRIAIVGRARTTRQSRTTSGLTAPLTQTWVLQSRLGFVAFRIQSRFCAFESRAATPLRSEIRS